MSKFNETINQYNEMAYGTGSNAKSITEDQLKDMLVAISDPDKIIKFTSVVNATNKRTNKETGDNITDVYKTSQVEAIMNFDYASKRTTASREAGEIGAADTHALGKSYGTHITSSVIEHNGRIYLQVSPVATLKPQFVIHNALGKFDVATSDQVKPFIKPSSKPSTTSAEKVPIRRYQLSSIVAIEIDKQDYKLSNVSPERIEVLKLVKLT